MGTNRLNGLQCPVLLLPPKAEGTASYSIMSEKGQRLRMLRRLVLAGLGVSCLLLAEESPRQKVQVSKTEHIDFQVGGVLRLNSSVGELTVEGWDRTDVEITTIKSTKGEYLPNERENAVKELDRIQVAHQRDDGELVISTSYPGGHALGCLMGASDGFDVEYRIKVPFTTRLIAHHGVGEVHVDNLASDIEASACQGEITLHLPQDGHYSTDAKSKFGVVFSDYPGLEKRRFWLLGHRVEKQDSQTAHKLNLRIGYGDIIILKTRIPQAPGPLTSAPKQSGV